MKFDLILTNYLINSLNFKSTLGFNIDDNVLLRAQVHENSYSNQRSDLLRAKLHINTAARTETDSFFERHSELRPLVDVDAILIVYLAVYGIVNLSVVVEVFLTLRLKLDTKLLIQVIIHLGLGGRVNAIVDLYNLSLGGNHIFGLGRRSYSNGHW